MLEESFDLMKVARSHIDKARFCRNQVPAHKAVANLGRAVVAAARALLTERSADPGLGGRYLLEEFERQFIVTGELPETSLGTLERAVKNARSNAAQEESVEAAFNEADIFVGDADKLLLDGSLAGTQGQTPAYDFSPSLPESGSRREDHHLEMTLVLRDVEDAWLAPLEG